MEKKDCKPQEDPVVFLARIVGECPDALSFLKTNQIKLLSKTTSDIYHTSNVNGEFLTHVACYHCTRHMKDNSNIALSKALLTPKVKHRFGCGKIQEETKCFE